MKVSELKGPKALKALQTYNSLLLGLKLLPAYATLSFEEFLETTKEMNEREKLDLLKNAAFFVPIENDELESLVCFCKDANGVPYTKENLKSMTPPQMIEAIVSVCLEISKFKINLVTEEEKKNLETSV